MDDLDKHILTAIQAALPAEERPYDALALRLGAEPADVLVRIRRLVDERLIRRIGPVFDSRRLGYVSTLVAARVPPARLEEVAAAVTRLPGVTHNYERAGTYNLWFTLTAPSQPALEATLDGLRRDTGIPDFHSLPALTIYKIRVQFDMEEAGPDPDVAHKPPALPGDGLPHDSSPGSAGGFSSAPLTEPEKQLIRLLQDGLAVEREPFAAAAANLGWTPAAVVEKIRAWIASGIIRRFGAVVRHRELGFAAGGMATFCVPPERVDDAGRRLAESPHVSHCYRRPPLPDFPYNLFAMTHGQTETEVRATVARLAADAGLADYQVLFSGREFKKASMRYFVE